MSTVEFQFIPLDELKLIGECQKQISEAKGEPNEDAKIYTALLDFAQRYKEYLSEIPPR